MEENEPQYPDSPNGLLDNLIDVKRALADVLRSLKAFNHMNGDLLTSARRAAAQVGLQDLFAESAYEFKPKGDKPWKPSEGEFVRVTSKDLIEDCESRSVFPGAVGIVHSRGSQWGWWVDHGPARCCYHAHELYPVSHGTGCTCPACVAQTAASREEAAAAEADEGLGPEPGILAPSAGDPDLPPRRGVRRATVTGGFTWLEFPTLAPDLIESLGRLVRHVWVEWARRQPYEVPAPGGGTVLAAPPAPERAPGGSAMWFGRHAMGKDGPPVPGVYVGDRDDWMFYGLSRRDARQWASLLHRYAAGEAVPSCAPGEAPCEDFRLPEGE